MWLIIVLGAAACSFTIYELPIHDLGLRFVLLALVTLSFGSRIIVQIPRVKGKISVSDTFILLTMLLFGGEAAILLAGADAFCSSLRISKRKFTVAFNTSVFICSTFLTVWTLRFCFGSITELSQPGYTSHFIIAICVMALVQYAVNSGLVATGVALKAGKPIWQMWRENFLWTSITYFAGASAAGITAKLIGMFGIHAFLATAPIIAIVYFTYCTYLKNVEASTTQAELAQRHVEELSSHIAEQRRISRALQESEEHFRNAFDHAAGMALVKADGHWLQVNDSLCKMLGYSEEELLTKSFQSMTYAEDLGNDLVQVYQLLEGEIATYQLEKRYVHKAGHPVWVLESASILRGAENKPLHMIFQIQDITERKRAEEHIHHAAFHDALTGLPNRTLLSNHLSLAVERAKRNRDYQFAVLFLDLDRFKIVNDSLGHSLGDKLLIELSRRLESCLRKMDTVARLGGDEFGILLDGIEDDPEAMSIVERIQQALMLPFDLDGHEFYTTASIGIAFSATGYEQHEDILRDADTAMYRAKANGKSRYEVFNKEMHNRAVELLRLENDLRRAIERQDIVPYFQPIIALETGKITGFEALARWQHLDRGLILPADFIPMAEETGLIIPLGMSVLRQSCKQLCVWQKEFPSETPLTMSVNLSSKQFRQADLVDEITSLVAEIELDPSHLRLEVTESVVMEDAETAFEMLRELKSLGVQISIDDFGTGYSSLSYLHRFPFDILKIDRSFINRMNVDKESQGIVKTIMTLAAELDKAVVAEGVETEEQRALLADLSCQYAQGYLFSRPVNVEAAERLLRDEFQGQTSAIISELTRRQEDVEVFTGVYPM